jgi:hypothetical protein
MEFTQLPANTRNTFQKYQKWGDVWMEIIVLLAFQGHLSARYLGSKILHVGVCGANARKSGAR